MEGHPVDKILDKYGEHIKVLSTITTIALAILAIGNVYSFYRNSIWKPNVSVVSFDFDKANAVISIGGTNCMLYGNSTLNAGGDWGVRFGTVGLDAGEGYDTIELVKNEMVFDILTYKDKTV